MTGQAGHLATRASEPQIRVMQQRQDLDRCQVLQGAIEHQTGQRAGRGLAERLAARFFDVDVPTGQFLAHPPRELPVRRDERRRAPSLERFAQRDRDGTGFFVLVGRFDQRHAAKRCSRVENGMAPAVGGRGGAQSFAHEPAPGQEVRGRVAESQDRGARGADLVEKAAQGRLGMGRRCLFAGHGADRAPRVVVEPLVESRQDHGALRQAAHGCDQPGRRFVGAGRPCHDDRATDGAGRQALHLGLDQPHLTGGGVDPLHGGQDLRVLRDGDVEEVEGDPPVTIEVVRREGLDPGPGHVLDDEFVDQGREFARQMPGIRRRRRDQQGLFASEAAPAVGFDRHDGVAHGLAPAQDQPREDHAPGDGAERHGKVGRDIVAEARLLEQKFGVVESAERHDAGKQGRGGPEARRQRGPEGAGRPPCRDVEGGGREAERPGGPREAVDQAPVEQSVAERLEEGRARRDRKDVWCSRLEPIRHHRAEWSRAASASAMAPGVPT